MSLKPNFRQLSLLPCIRVIWVVKFELYINRTVIISLYYSYSCPNKQIHLSRIVYILAPRKKWCYAKLGLF